MNQERYQTQLEHVNIVRNPWQHFSSDTFIICDFESWIWIVIITFLKKTISRSIIRFSVFPKVTFSFLFFFFLISFRNMFLFFGNQCKLSFQLPPGKTQEKTQFSQFWILRPSAGQLGSWTLQLFVKYCVKLKLCPCSCPVAFWPKCSTQPPVKTGHGREQI